VKPHAIAVEQRLPARRAWIDENVLRRAAEVALDDAAWSGEGLSIVLVSDAEIARLHQLYLDDPTETDVITFDLRDEWESGVPVGERTGGELLVSADTAERCARERGHSPLVEAQLYVVHGALHLLGEDDHEAEARARMRDRERAVFERLGVPYPY
jgi:probable rRNA maturation factor